MPVSPRLLHFKKVTNLGANSSPQIVPAKLVVLIDWPKQHEMKILLWTRGHCENILGCPKDQLGTPMSRTLDTKIVKVSLDLGDII